MADDLISRIKTRLNALDLTPRGASLKADMSDRFITNIFDGKSRSPRSDSMQKLARALGTTEVWLMRGEGPESPEASREPAAVPMRMPPPNASPPVPIHWPNVTIPILGQAKGGSDGRFVLNGNKVMDVLCPPQLVGVEGAYGVFVHGDSMSPRYEPGEAVFVNPHRPVKQGDDVVVQIAGEFEGDEVSGFVKRFVSQSSRELVLFQFKTIDEADSATPESERNLLRFPTRLVVAIHKIVARSDV